jgi:hypothetical protein
MGLINLQTNLKGLGFGDDRYKRGNSNEPYIQTQIPATDEPLQTGFSLSSGGLETLGIIAASAGVGAVAGAVGGSILGATGAGALIGTVAGLGIGIAGASLVNTGNSSFKVPSAGTGGPDFLLRGGTLLPNRIANDVERISKLIIDTKSAKGFLFVTKQNILSRLSVKTEGTRNSLLNDDVYLPTSTLASVAGVAFGGYYNKQGLNPFEGIGEQFVPNRYYDNVKIQLIDSNSGISNSISTNRLYVLLENKILGNPKFNGLGISTLPGSPDLLSYRGGPGAPLGIGETNIKIISPEQRTGINNINGKKIINTKDPNTGLITSKGNYLSGLAYSPTNRSGITFNGNNLLGASDAYFAETEINGNLIEEPLDNGFNFPEGQQTKPYGPQDDNSTLSTDNKINAVALNYNRIIGKSILNKEQSRTDNKKYVKYLNELSGSYNGVAEFKDITTDTLYTGSLVDRTINGENIEADNFDKDSDIIDFHIEIINRNTTYYFPAYINNFSDGYSVKWNAEKFLGRGEDFYTYNGFSRDFSLSFTTYARNPYAMQRMYDNLNKITAALTPDYGTNGFMKGNLFKITLGSYLQNQPCIIESFKFENIIADNITWQLNKEFELPYLFNINMSFKPIYNVLPNINNPTFIDSNVIVNIGSEIDFFKSL